MLNIAAEASVMVTRAMDRWRRPPCELRRRVQTVKYLMFVPSGMFIAVTSSPMQGAHPLIIYQDGPEPHPAWPVSGPMGTVCLIQKLEFSRLHVSLYEVALTRFFTVFTPATS